MSENIFSLEETFEVDEKESAVPFEKDIQPKNSPNGFAKTVNQEVEKHLDALMKDLNPEQKDAVLTTEGAVLVLSGAGTGKTRVLTTRTASLILSKKCRPYQCMAVTFTNKAAREMKERLAAMIGADSEEVWLGTFHRFGLKILRRHAALVGLSSDFVILDEDDQERLAKQLLQSVGLDTKTYSPRVFCELVDKYKNKGFLPSMLSDFSEERFADGRFKELYQMYQNRLKALNAVDFGDLLLLSFEIMKNNPQVGALYQNRFKYILVDEYQDTNVIQYLWLRFLARGHNNLCCVGDDDQSIYSWRGAEIENILRFSKDFPNAKIIRLESNYRSTEAILKAASGLIAHNKGRLGKQLRVAPSGNPNATSACEKVAVYGSWSGKEEASRLSEQIEEDMRRGVPLSQIAVLVRAGFQTREFEEAFSREGIAYKVIGGFKFYEREEIKDFIAYLRVVAQPKDDLAFQRIINKPKRGIGSVTLKTLQETALQEGCSIYEAVEKSPLKGKTLQTLLTFTQQIDFWKEQLEQELPPSKLAQKILNESGYLQMWREENSIEAQGRIENLKELLNVIASDYSTLETFLDHVSLVMDTDEQDSEEHVSIMTLHGAKGLEFDIVYLPGWEEGLFPHQKSLEESGDDALEEERRLAYVGLTRARKKACISFAANRLVYGKWQSSVPSRFIEELPSEYLEVHTQQGIRSDFSYSGGYEDEADADSFFDSSFLKNENRGYFSRNEPSFGKTAPVFSSRPEKQQEYNGIKRGTQVYHDTFGYGTVMAVEGPKLDIYFEGLGRKKIMAQYVEKIK